MKKEFKYDAFISYRHTELDKFVAENLHKELEAFHMPASLVKKRKGMKNKIERVFRDKEELHLSSNLEEPIMEALKSSEWLIVICSPRLKESLWCRKEIETFVALRGREHVLVVLAEGEPEDSFPEELLYRLEKIEKPDGTVEEVKVPIEPLAADMRGENRKEVLKNMKTEILRLEATMFSVDFDDLRQRHRERRMRRIVGASLVIGTACLLFGIYSGITAMRIQKQKEQIETQSAQIVEQSAEIQKQNEELALRQAKSLAESATYYLRDGNRSAAIQTALEALTESGGITIPYTPEAELILAESTRAYDICEIYRAEYQYETSAMIECIEESKDGDTLAIVDEAEYLTLYDVANREVIRIFEPSEYKEKNPSGYEFLGENIFVYINTEGVVCLYDLEQKAVTAKLNPGSAVCVDADEEGNYLLVKSSANDFNVYDGKSLEYLGTTPQVERRRASDYQYVSEDGILADVAVVGDDYLNVNYSLFLVDLNKMELLGECFLGDKVPADIKVKDDVVFVLSQVSVKNNTDADTYTTAISIADGKILWENVQHQQYPAMLMLPHAEDATDILVTTGESFHYINMQTGEVFYSDDLDFAPVSAYQLINSSNFILFCENGQMYGLSRETKLMAPLSGRFECSSDQNKYILYSEYGMAVNGTHDNIITFYTVELGPKMEIIDSDIQSVSRAERFDGEFAYEIARNLGLEKPEFVDNVCYSEDEKYCLVKYGDERLVICEVGVGIVSAIQTEHPIHACLGPDAAGRYYLLGTHGGFILNQNMSPIAWVPNAVNVDVEEQKIYLKYSAHSYVTPVYTTEELLELARTRK